MNLTTFFKEKPIQHQKVFYDNREYNMHYQHNLNNFIIIINYVNDISIDERNWSKINFREHYEEDKFISFISLCEEINKNYNVLFSVFPDTLKKEDFSLSTVTMVTGTKHPIDKFDFKSNQPGFPFTIDLDIIASNLYYFEKFQNEFIKGLRYMSVKDFIDLVKCRVKRECDFLNILMNNYQDIGGNVGQIVDLFCLPSSKDYNVLITRHFLPLIEKGLDQIDYLHIEYIKLY